jgi:hypothetical protein
MDGANFFKAVLDGADLAGAFLTGAQILNCALLVVTGTGNRPSAMRRLPVARLFRKGNRQNRRSVFWAVIASRGF